MKDFMILHFGFEQPSPEDMAEWNKWFDQVTDRQVDKGGLRDGKEIFSSGISELSFGKDSITGYTIIRAGDLDEAVKIAEQCPIVASTQVYEIMRW